MDPSEGLIKDALRDVLWREDFAKHWTLKCEIEIVYGFSISSIFWDAIAEPAVGFI